MASRTRKNGEEKSQNQAADAQQAPDESAVPPLKPGDEVIFHATYPAGLNGELKPYASKKMVVGENPETGKPALRGPEVVEVMAEAMVRKGLEEAALEFHGPDGAAERMAKTPTTPEQQEAMDFWAAKNAEGGAKGSEDEGQEEGSGGRRSFSNATLPANRWPFPDKKKPGGGDGVKRKKTYK